MKTVQLSFSTTITNSLVDLVRVVTPTSGILLHPEVPINKKEFGSRYDEIMMKFMMKPMMQLL